MTKGNTNANKGVAPRKTKPPAAKSNARSASKSSVSPSAKTTGRTGRHKSINNSRDTNARSGRQTTKRTPQITKGTIFEVEVTPRHFKLQSDSDVTDIFLFIGAVVAIATAFVIGRSL